MEVDGAEQMKQKLLHKLNKRHGFSLTEMLATVLIMGFVGIIITTGAATVQRVYRKVVAHANAQTALTTTITLMKDQLAFADPESIGGGSGTETGFENSQTIVFQNLNSGEQTITLNPGTANRGFTLTYSAAGTGTGTNTTLPLLSDSAITSDLCVCFDGDGSGFSWDPATKVITVTNLVAKDIRTDTVQAHASFKVLLVNCLIATRPMTR